MTQKILMSCLLAGGLVGCYFNVSAEVDSPMIQESNYRVVIPEAATFFLGTKSKHFVDFTEVPPVKIESCEEGKILSFQLDNSKVYNFRTRKEGGLTRGGYFTMSADETKRPSLRFTDEDYAEYPPNRINHSVDSNDGYETGDIFVNINPQGYLRMQPGEVFEAHAMRSWELTDNAVGNYFIEPDFHYSVLNTDGSPSEGVIEIENADAYNSPWSKIKAVGEGTVIVLVTYDAIALDYYSGATKKPYMGGELWGAIWPENTAVYVVSVGGQEAESIGNMIVNEEYNSDTSKLAGRYVDAEHDVFYYLRGSDGARFSFTPENTLSVSLARPVIEDERLHFSGFSDEGVEANEDGSYTLTLIQGRNIVRLTDAEGNATYQVITAKECDMEITNETDATRSYFFPGDKVKVQFEGLRHPANKIAGVYNMSAGIAFNDLPEGVKVSQSTNQYKFGSTPKAQAITFTIPADYNPAENPELHLGAGSILNSGYGDPIGNHRGITAEEGRLPNFTAVAHKTYLCQLPDVTIHVDSPVISEITSTEAEREIQSIFSVDGQRRESLSEGMNIVIFSDGTVKKIMKK